MRGQPNISIQSVLIFPPASFLPVGNMRSNTNNAHSEPEFPHPFVDRSLYWDSDVPGSWAPRAVVELNMCRLSATLREKPEWWRKARDPEIRKKWFEEAKSWQEKKPKWWRMSDNMCGPYDCIWLSDKLIPVDVRDALRTAAAPLENVSDAQKDWHPGSKQQVLDLVHPSLYPLVYHRTLGKRPDGTIGTFAPPVPSYYDHNRPFSEDEHFDTSVIQEFISPRFQWLPSDYEVYADGTVRLTSEYINNVPPEHAPRLVPVLERIVARAVPLWERVLSDLRRGEPNMRLGPVIEDDSDGNETDLVSVPKRGLACVWRNHEPEDPDWEEGEKYLIGRRGTPQYESWRYSWFLNQPMALPDSPAEYDGRLTVKGENTFSLKGRTIQVMTKLANIVLTPEKPSYPGGTWHVEGMWNERIVSTFIYYYDSQNIQDTRLAFRQPTADPTYHQQDDEYCMWVLYHMKRDKPCVQDIGSIVTKEGRCIAFPNLFQHRVSPFALTDPTKPGVRRILALFLVDPTRRVPSATDIAPQQNDWFKDILYDLHESSSSRMSTLPPELIDKIQAELTPGMMSREEALTIREELMKERSVNADQPKSLFTGGFNMCEH
ncbi:hypothetical protein K523DRAFT_417386 [Schizophyllum commune Tattone D]|nr:hypothetical protein K523DRAFT_417386 [Schizophyllum commune Tattone D]